MKYFEDLVIGERTQIGSHTFHSDEIKAFALRFDPQLFHLDEDAAARTHFGGLCASGWHTAAQWMRLMVDYRKREAERMQARGEAVARLGPSPGFHDLKWLKPVYPGDTISYASQLLEKRVSASRPQWGIVTLLNTGTNQHGDMVISFVSNVFSQRRPSTAT